MNTFETQRSGDYEFEAFDGAEYEGENFGETGFGEAEFGEGEFLGGELEGEWEGEVRDHRRRYAPQAAVRARSYRRPAPGYRPTAWSSRSRSYTPRPARWGTRTSYGSRPVSRSWSSSWARPWSTSSYRPAGQQYRWGQPGLSSQWYRGGQYPGRYWRFGQGQSFPGATSGWGSFGRWRRRYPYGRYGYGLAYAQPDYDEPAEPPYEEPPMPPPVIVAAPPPPPPQPPMAEPPVEPPPPPMPGQAGQAQAPAKAEEFFIEPEAFEFDMESPGYEGEQFESGFGEFESGPGALPNPPVDTSPVSGCETAGRPFDDFAFGSPTVPARHEPRIKELARTIVTSWITDTRFAIRTVCLEGHTDNIGKADLNMKLGQARAEDLRDKLRQAIFDEATKIGYGPQITNSVKILVTSRGKDAPVDTNSTELGRRRNRRVRFAFST